MSVSVFQKKCVVAHSPCTLCSFFCKNSLVPLSTWYTRQNIDGLLTQTQTRAHLRTHLHALQLPFLSVSGATKEERQCEKALARLPAECEATIEALPHVIVSYFLVFRYCCCCRPFFFLLHLWWTFHFRSSLTSVRYKHLVNTCTWLS